MEENKQQSNARAYVIAQLERQGYSSQLAADVHDGLEADCEECWTNKEFSEWLSSMETKHNQTDSYLLKAYEACGRYMNEYAGAISKF